MRIGQQQEGFVPDPIVAAMEQQSSAVVLEIDTDAFLMEEQARMLRGERGYKPRETVEWQFGGYVFSLGFMHKCSNCGHRGARKEFNKFEMPPWRCPKCRSREVYQDLPLESEREEYPEPIANLAYRNKRVYPNQMTPDGQMLVQKDTSQPAIPLLRKVSRISGRGTKEREEIQTGFQCSFCAESFKTLHLLHRHRVEAHGLGGGALPEAPKLGEKVNGVTTESQPTPKPARVLAVEKPPEPPKQPEPETVSAAAWDEPEANDLAERRSPAEIRAMLRQAQKVKGGKAGGPEAE